MKKHTMQSQNLKIILLALLFLVAFDQPSFAQTPNCETTVSLPASADAMVFSRPDIVNANNGAYIDHLVTTWTWRGVRGSIRALIKFDLSSLPANAQITNATLKLYGYDGPNLPNGAAHSGATASFLSVVSSPWQEMMVTWNSQPSTTTSLAIPQLSNVDNLTADVTQTAIDWVNGTIDNQGWQLRLQTESTYRRLTFGARENPNPALRPQLCITYTHIPAKLAPQNCPSCNKIIFDFCKGDPTSDLEVLLMNNTNHEQGSSFLWYEDNNGVQGNPIGTPTVNTNQQKKRFYWVSQVGPLCEGDAQRVRVRVRKNSIVELELPAIGCNGGQIDLAAGVSDKKHIASGFTFYDSDPDLGNPTPIGSVTATQGNVNNGQYAIVTLPSNPITYYATATNNTGCQVTGSEEIISGGGALLAPVSNVTVNSGQTVSIQFTSTNATHVIWHNKSNPQIGMVGHVGLGDILFTAVNNSANTKVANLFAIVYQGNCAGEIRHFTVSVLSNKNMRQTQNSLELQALTLNTHDVQLSWQIHYEFPLTHFEVEKQTENGSWEKIADASYAATQSAYSYLDRGGLSENTKYRLKLIHVDGRAVWSEEVLVGANHDLALLDANRFTIYPNPNAGHFSLKALVPIEGTWSYSIIDYLGRTIQTGKFNSHENALNISKQPTGIYFLELASPAGERVVKRVIKE